MASPTSVRSLEKFGREQLSPSFFMRDFLYSEISQIERIPNIPDEPDIAIEVGKRLCLDVLEPIQARFGRISIRSAYRAPAVNAKGAENQNQYGCASNISNYAAHIWDHKDTSGHKGAMACIVVNGFLPYFKRTKDWPAMVWWVHDNVPGYSSMEFFANLAAFNIGWHQKPSKKIESHIAPKGVLTKPGMSNHEGSHIEAYADFLREIEA